MENVNINSTSISDIDIDIRCDGYGSCDQLNSMSQSGGDVYLSGYWSGSGLTLETTNESNIYFTGSKAGEPMDIINGNNVYCLADSGFSLYITNANNILAAGYASLYDCDTFNISGGVYCTGRRSCWKGTIDSVAGNIYGIGDNALRSAVISNVADALIVAGEYTMEAATATNIENVSLRVKFVCLSFGFCFLFFLRLFGVLNSWGCVFYCGCHFRFVIFFVTNHQTIKPHTIHRCFV